MCCTCVGIGITLHYSVGNLVELAGHMDAGIGHDDLAPEQFGQIVHDEEDDGDHDDEDDDNY